MMPRLRAIAATASRSTSLSSGLVGLSTHSMLVFGLIALSQFPGSKGRERRLDICRALAHALEDAVAAAVEVVHRHDVRARVEELEHGADRRHARGEGEAVLSALELGDARLERVARRVRVRA
jgi:hypothetical protein